MCVKSVSRNCAKNEKTGEERDSTEKTFLARGEYFQNPSIKDHRRSPMGRSLIPSPFEIKSRDVFVYFISLTAPENRYYQLSISLVVNRRWMLGGVSRCGRSLLEDSAEDFIYSVGIDGRWG